MSDETVKVKEIHASLERIRRISMYERQTGKTKMDVRAGLLWKRAVYTGNATQVAYNFGQVFSMDCNSFSVLLQNNPFPFFFKLNFYCLSGWNFKSGHILPLWVTV